jgi:uncharacterized protein YbjQ (UPF0145 family)
MKLQSSRFLALIALTMCVLTGCASAPKNGVEIQAGQVKVYEPDRLLRDKYESVRYLWVDSWRTAFWLPSASSESEGIALLQTEAARLGANGLINVSCTDQGHFMWSSSTEPSILCYGHAIRVR